MRACAHTHVIREHVIITLRGTDNLLENSVKGGFLLTRGEGNVCIYLHLLYVIFNNFLNLK